MPKNPGTTGFDRGKGGILTVLDFSGAQVNRVTVSFSDSGVNLLNLLHLLRGPPCSRRPQRRRQPGDAQVRSGAGRSRWSITWAPPATR